jgi:hypothetical protein
MSIDFEIGTDEGKIPEIDSEKMFRLKKCITKYLDPKDFTGSYNKKHNSNAFHYYFEEILGFSFTNLDFKKAMKELKVPCAPCATSTEGEVYTIYPISQKIVDTIMDDTVNYVSEKALKAQDKENKRIEYWLGFFDELDPINP